MLLRPEEISEILKTEIEKYNLKVVEEEVGTVISVGDNMAIIYGLRSAQAGELVEFPNKIYGLVFNLEQDTIGCMILGRASLISEGVEVRRTGRIIQVPVGEELLGRVVDPLGRPLDGKGPVPLTKVRPIEFVAPKVIQRQPVNVPLQTGVKAIDALVPIGRGQRELIIGDRQTGKTALTVDAIINQKGKNVICIYVAIGQKTNNIASVVDVLSKYGAMDYTIVVSAAAQDPATLLYIAPYAGCAMGEYFTYNGKDVLIIYDDLTKHAQAYREISLLLKRPPGREAYPGDVFYLHSRLLERAAKLSDELGAGSLTALPIIETQLGDISAYIPTNLISITDGQIYLDKDMFYQGYRPAVEAGLSVSRVGGAAQIKAMKQVAGRLRLDLAQFRELAAFTKFSTEELDQSSRDQLTRGERIMETLKQKQFVPLEVEDQVFLLYLAVNGYLDKLEIEQVGKYEEGFLKFLDEKMPDIKHTVSEKKSLEEQTLKKLEEAALTFQKTWIGNIPVKVCK